MVLKLCEVLSETRIIMKPHASEHHKKWMCGTKYQHILNIACELRFQTGSPIKFWAECYITACNLISRHHLSS